MIVPISLVRCGRVSCLMRQRHQLLWLHMQGEMRPSAAGALQMEVFHTDIKYGTLLAYTYPKLRNDADKSQKRLGYLSQGS